MGTTPEWKHAMVMEAILADLDIPETGGSKL